MGKYYTELVLKILANNTNMYRKGLISALLKGRKISNDWQNSSYHMIVGTE